MLPSLHRPPPPSPLPPPSLLPTWSMLSLIGRMESLTDASSMDGCIASSGRVNSTFRHTYMCGRVIDTTWWYMQTCVQTGMELMKTTSSAFRTLFVVQVLEQRGYTLEYLTIASHIVQLSHTIQFIKSHGSVNQVTWFS